MTILSANYHRAKRGGVHEPTHSVVGAAVVVACSRCFSPACTTTLQGKAVSVFDDPFSVAGMPATDGPTGLRADAQDPTREVRGHRRRRDRRTGAQARSATSRSTGTSAYSDTFDGEFTPVEALISWDANGFDDAVLRRRHVRSRQRGVLLRRRDHRLGPRRAAARAAQGLRGHGRDDGARPRVRPRGAASGRAGQARAPRRWWPSSRPTASQAPTCAGSPRATRRASR